jgi:hypothetical protein
MMQQERSGGHLPDLRRFFAWWVTPGFAGCGKTAGSRNRGDFTSAQRQWPQQANGRANPPLRLFPQPV